MLMTHKPFTNNAGFRVIRDEAVYNHDLPYSLQLGTEQEAVIDLAMEGHNVLMHGPAGTGKSITVKRLLQLYNKRNTNYALMAYTGAAAVHIRGTTIHSFFRGLGLMDGEVDILIKKAKRSRELVQKIKSVEVLLIDEISMVPAPFFVKIDTIFRAVTGVDLPFGGKQVLMFGDFFQLPPIDKDSSSGAEFVFETDLWEALELTVIHATCVYRQNDPEFVDLLNELRVGEVSMNTMALLMPRVCEVKDRDDNEDNIRPTILYSRNIDVDTMNHEELMRLNTPSVTHESECIVTPKPLSTEKQLKELYRKSKDIEKHCVAPMVLTTKVGAQVMLRKNMLTHDLFNGSRGVVIGYGGTNNRFPVVQFTNGTIHTIYPHRFEYHYPFGSVAVVQIPLILAWAITIHKSQGCTVDRLHMSMEGIRTPGQAYVAFSRVRSLSGLTISNFNPRVVRAHPKVIAAFKPKANDNDLLVNKYNKRK